MTVPAAGFVRHQPRARPESGPSALESGPPAQGTQRPARSLRRAEAPPAAKIQQAAARPESGTALIAGSAQVVAQDSHWQGRQPPPGPQVLGDSPANVFQSTKGLMATPQGRRLGYRTPEQVSNPEPPDSRPCVNHYATRGGWRSGRGGGVLVNARLRGVRRHRAAPNSSQGSRRGKAGRFGD